MVLGVVLLGSLLTPKMRGAPLVLSLTLGLAIVVALGAIMLKFRAKSVDGEPLTNVDAVKISAMAYGFLSIVVGAIMGLMLTLD